VSDDLSPLSSIDPRYFMEAISTVVRNVHMKLTISILSNKHVKFRIILIYSA